MTTKDAASFLFDEKDREISLRVNKEFASKYEQRKRKQELQHLQHLHQDDEDASSDSDSETEDEDGECLTEKLDNDIERTLKLIKEKDPSIYDPKATFFDRESSPDEDEDEAKRPKKDKPVYYKDLVRQHMLQGNPEGEEEQVKTYAQEQDDIRGEFLKSVKGFDKAAEDDKADSEDEFFQKRTLTKEEKQQKDKEYEEFRQANPEIAKTQEDDERFLQNFLHTRGWVDKDVLPSYDEIVDDEEDAEELDKADEFEHQYNFRFEEEGGSVIQTHARDVPNSMRRVDDTRKRKRAERAERKALERKKKEDEIRRLKNLKQQELDEKLNKIYKMAGHKHASKMDTSVLDGDFNPEDHDRQMQQLFNDDYYGEADDKKPTWDDEDDAFLGIESTGQDEEKDDSPNAEASVSEDSEDDEPSCNIIERPVLSNEDKEAIEKEKKKHLDELYKLDYEDLIGDMPCRFKYRQVPKNDYGLSLLDILNADDKDLKKFVSLKRMAPYSTREYKVSNTKIKQFKRDLQASMETKTKQEEQVEEVKEEAPVELAAGDTEAPNPATSKKRRKRRKKAKTEAVSGPVISSSRLESYRLKPLDK